MPKTAQPEAPKRGRGRPPGRSTHDHMVSFTEADWAWLKGQGKPSEVIRDLIDLAKAAQAVMGGK